MKLHCSITGMTTLCLAVALLAGCSRSPRVTFYTLNVAATNEAPAPPINSVAIGPITLPDLLDRPQLVVRTSANQVDILETHRWAESLKSEIPRIIAADLGILLKPARVSIYPQNAGLDADYRVLLDIQRFEMTVGKGSAWMLSGRFAEAMAVFRRPAAPWSANLSALLVMTHWWRRRVGRWQPSAAIWHKRCAKWRGLPSRNEPERVVSHRCGFITFDGERMNPWEKLRKFCKISLYGLAKPPVFLSDFTIFCSARWHVLHSSGLCDG